MKRVRTLAWSLGALAALALAYQFGWQHGSDGWDLNLVAAAHAETAAEGARDTFFPKHSFYLTSVPARC